MAGEPKPGGRKASPFWVLLVALLGIAGCHGRPADAPGQHKSQPAAQQPVQAHVETPEEKSCREFVQAFYDWYLQPIARNKTHPTGAFDIDDVLRLKRFELSQELYSLLKKDRDVQAKSPGEITGLDFDPFTNSQDSSPRFLVQSAVVSGNSCRTAVWGMDGSEHRETVEPEARRINGKWIFVNFYYRFEVETGKPRIEGDLMHILKGYRH